MAYSVKITDRLEDGGASVRHTVFIEEQGFEEEIDRIDMTTAHHLQVLDGDQVIAAGRVFPEDDDCWHIGRVAVLPAYRRKGVGRLIMEHLEAHARECGAAQTILSAQCQAVDFYKKCGYTQKGDVYYEESCPHILMVKKL